MIVISLLFLSKFCYGMVHGCTYLGLDVSNLSQIPTLEWKGIDFEVCFWFLHQRSVRESCEKIGSYLQEVCKADEESGR